MERPRRGRWLFCEAQTGLLVARVDALGALTVSKFGVNLGLETRSSSGTQISLVALLSSRGRDD